MLVVVSLAAYAGTILLVGLAAGFGHAPGRWLTTGALTALAIGMGATAGWRISWFALDPEARKWWWSEAGWPARILRTFSLGVRAAAALVILVLAVKSLAQDP